MYDTVVACIHFDAHSTSIWHLAISLRAAAHHPYSHFIFSIFLREWGRLREGGWGVCQWRRVRFEFIVSHFNNIFCVSKFWMAEKQTSHGAWTDAHTKLYWDWARTMNKQTSHSHAHTYILYKRKANARLSAFLSYFPETICSAFTLCALCNDNKANTPLK